MLYLNPALAMLSFPDDAPPVALCGDTLYYRLTVDLWAWVVQSCHKAKKAHEAGRLSADTLATIRERFRALQAVIPQFDPAELREALSRPQALPSPDVTTAVRADRETSDNPGAAGAPPVGLSDAFADADREAALAAHDLDRPPAFDGSDAPRVLLSWPDHPGFLVLTADRLEAILAWNQGADQRARKAAGSSARRKPAKAADRDRGQLEIGQSGSEAAISPENR